MTAIRLSEADLLKTYFRYFKTAIVALSGGVDSAAALKLSVDFLGRQNVTAMTCSNSHIFNYEIENSRKIASVLGVKWIPFETDFPDSFYLNDEKRCFYCKESIMSYIEDYGKTETINVIFDGSTIDDLGENRPGFEAIKKLNIKSPLLETGKNKDFAREICKYFERKRIFFNDESCVATRICGQKISKELLIKIEKIEDELRYKYKGIRVRCHPEQIQVEFKYEFNLSIEDKEYIKKIISKYAHSDLPVIF